MKRFSLILSVVLVLSIAYDSTAAQNVGGYRAVSPASPEANAAARFAVRAHKQKASGDVSLVSLVKAEQQVVAGTNYRLCLKVKDKEQIKEASAVVFRNLKNRYALTSWNWDNCAPADHSSAAAPMIYQGALPCADCEGIKTTLTFFGNETYSLQETYLTNRPGKHVFMTRGKYATMRGTATDPNATVYQLNPDKPTDIRNFLRVGANRIKQLDRDQREINAPFDYTLTMQEGAQDKLENTSWKLTELNGRSVKANEQNREPQLRLVADGHRVQGQGGCNSFFGSYDLTGNKIKFSKLGSTRMACTKGMEQETAYLKALEDTTVYKLENGKLGLYRGDELLARFETAGMKN